ncbi:unnamed protein product [Spirodela intermedia]|uniref:Non-specific lipid-transfer protein n=1 Tax=Spirodela intermedia TaxID=51605 RepID=A0A7I8K0H8_SPIIN|nr:unnamed protein product [Spirodela intermedia]
MGARGAMLVVAAAAIVFLVVAPVAESAISCDVVYSNLNPCLNYVLFGGMPPPQCCQGARNLLAAARTPADRQSICRCLKNASQGATGPISDNAATLPMKCNMNIPYRISPSTDCNRFSLSLPASTDEPTPTS